MTEQIYINRQREIIQNLPLLKKKLDVEIIIKGRNLIIRGESIKEYEASQVFKAINFGFSAKKALLLLDDNYQFVTTKIKTHTRRHLSDIKARLIGKEGKTKRAIENISGCNLIINERENAVGILGNSENVKIVMTAITSLIKGSKQANIYAFLEKMNRQKYTSDLGLKSK